MASSGFEGGGRATSQGLQVDSRGWKRQENRFSPEAAEGTQPGRHLGLGPVSPGSDPWHPEL